MSIIEPPKPTPEDIPLFAGFEPPEPEPVEDLSADQRRTKRQAADVARAIHPLTRGPIHALASTHRDASAPKSDPFTCGSCLFRKVEKHHDRSYPKCWLPSPSAGADAPAARIYTRVSNSAASDVRAWWPACPDYSPGASLSDDAARYIPEASA